ncbi:LysR family transcriptional regulator [Alkalimonas collagenimarina]|uniref:LysR family transcriptional regulator n=1 Tax=Alkalimonas collagenimarina TaxID=400390 RepID=A0ABT9GUM0_9GAMM|nr:LysR family transcriptional regulator [Alkalimonas collagenimarina]MDP4534751.1 LysR family transcriptional regulator [Alkalimonas collagenimarina]
MDKLKAMNTFVVIVEQGSLSAAADKLDRSPAAVVRTLASLEQHLGVRLLNRSTRHIALTEEGTDYLQHCRRILADIQATEFRLDSCRTEPAGKLSITAPVMFGRLHLAPLLNQWLKHNPAMSAELTLLDRVVDVIEEKFDLALRIGHLADSSLVARTIGSTPYLLCASPEFIAQRGMPSHPAELAEWPTVCFAPAGEVWQFQVEGKLWEQRIHPVVSANQIDAGLAAARDGVGICRVLGYQAQQDLEQGTLVPVLTEYEPPPLPVQFVFPHSRLLSPRVRQFLDAVIEPLQQRLQNGSC